MDTTNTYEFPEYDWSFKEFERLFGGNEETTSTMKCEAEMEVFQETLVVLPKFTEGILVGGHILVMIFSGCGNIAALIIVIKSKAPKLSTKYFLIMLALSDLLMTVVAPPAEIGKLISEYNEWIFGELTCKLVPFLQLVSATMSAMCLMAIAAERNFLIVRAMSSSTSLLSKWQTCIVPLMGVSIIVIPIACALPQVWYYGFRSFHAIPAKPSQPPPGSGVTSTTPSPITTAVPAIPACDIRNYCYRNDFDKRNIVYWSVTGLTYFLLLVCFLISYISIYKFVKKHGQFRKQLEEENYSTTTITATGSTSQTSDQNGGAGPSYKRVNLAAAERHRKTLKLIIGLILLHLCCRTPNWVYLVIVNVIKVKLTETTLTLLECLHLLSTVNCALNPFLYVIWNHSLRANGDGGNGTNRGVHSAFCKRTGNIFRAICCSRCGKYERDSMEGQIPTDPVIPPTSSAWLWKTPTVYHVYNVSGSSENKKTNSTSNQRNLYSEKIDM